MKNGNIFLDLDDLIIKSKPLMISYINKTYNINSIEQDYKDKNEVLLEVIHKYNKNINITSDEFYLDYAKNFLESVDWHKDLQLMEFAKETIFSLAKKYNLYIVTARQKSGNHVVNYLLDKHFYECFTGVHHVWEHCEDSGYKNITKRSFILGMKSENIAFIDDSPNEILKTQDIIPSYLFDPNGTQEQIGKGVVNNWKQIGELFL